MDHNNPGIRKVMHQMMSREHKFSSEQDRIEFARKKLDEAIALHEKHMNGTAPTTGKEGEASQMKMMMQMKSARSALG